MTLIIAAACAGLAALARYAGIAVIGTGIVVLLAVRETNWKTRAIQLIAYIGIGTTPLLLWLVRNRVVAGSFTDREVAFSPMGLGVVRQAYLTVANWLLPANIDSDIRKLLLLGGFLAIAIATIWIWKVRVNAAREANEQGYISATFDLPTIYLVFAGFSAATVILSKAFIDPSIPFNDRIMSPVLIAGILFAVMVLHSIYDHFKTSAAMAGAKERKGLALMRFVSVAALAYVLILQTGQTWEWSSRAYTRGLGYASVSWHNAMSIQFVLALPDDTPIFSNAPEAVNVLTEHPAYLLPPSPTGEGTDERFQAEIEFMERTLREQSGVVIYYDQITWRDLVTDVELLSILPLETVLVGKDESVYRLAD